MRRPHFGRAHTLRPPARPRDIAAMTIQLYQYPKCGTCRKARAWLDEHAVTYESIDIVAAPPSHAQLGRIQALAEVPVRKLFNTSGQSYRQGGFKDRLASMSDDEALAALAADGKLIKRPLLVTDDWALVGFRADDWKERLS